MGTAVDKGLIHSAIKFSSLVALLNIGVLYFLLSVIRGTIWSPSLSLMNELGRGFIWLIISAFVGTNVGVFVGWFISSAVRKRRMREEAEHLMALKMRLSRGEIGVEEYRKLRKTLDERTLAPEYAHTH